MKIEFVLHLVVFVIVAWLYATVGIAAFLVVAILTVTLSPASLMCLGSIHSEDRAISAFILILAVVSSVATIGTLYTATFLHEPWSDVVGIAIMAIPTVSYGFASFATIKREGSSVY